MVNADVPERDLWQVVLGSAAITQQLCTVIAAVSVPVHLRLGLLTGHTLLVVNILLLLIGERYCLCRLLCTVSVVTSVPVLWHLVSLLGRIDCWWTSCYC